ncbi:MAG: FHA domain-containing protein [bacterium]
MARVSCRTCGGKTVEGSFCDRCGAPLAPGPSAATPAEAESGFRPEPTYLRRPGDSVGEAPSAVAAIIRTPDPDERPARIILLNTEPVNERTAAAQSVGTDDDGFGDCPWLCVESDTLAFCVAGASALVRFRLTPLVEGVQHVRVWLKPNGISQVVEHPFNWPNPKLGVPRGINLPVHPMNHGAFSASVYFGLTKDGKTTTYETEVCLFVYPADCSTKQVADNITFNINNDIKAGHAADIRVHQDAAEAVSKLVKNGQAHSIEELLNLLHSKPPAFHRLSLFESGWVLHHPLPAAPAAATAERVTLRVGNRIAHLIAGSRVTLGKNRANQIVTRLFEPDGEALPERNARISKFHCTLEYADGQCIVHDGVRTENGVMQASACGVFWQGRAVKGSERFPADRFPAVAALGLAGTADAYDFGLTAHGCFFDTARCAACGGRDEKMCHRGKTPAVILRRRDAVSEVYAVMWSCLDLGNILPGCEGVTVCHERGAFAWRAEGAAGWLVPGTRIGAGGVQIEVKTFSQYGL